MGGIGERFRKVANEVLQESVRKKTIHAHRVFAVSLHNS